MSGKSGRAAKAGETVLVVEDEVLLRLASPLICATAATK